MEFFIMKQTRRRIVSYLVTLSLLIGLLPVLSMSASPEQIDPFAAMYDSEQYIKQELIRDGVRIRTEAETELRSQNKDEKLEERRQELYRMVRYMPGAITEALNWGLNMCILPKVMMVSWGVWYTMTVIPLFIVLPLRNTNFSRC